VARVVYLPTSERDLLSLARGRAAASGLESALQWMDLVAAKTNRLAFFLYLGAESELLGPGRHRLVLCPHMIVYRVAAPDLDEIIRVVDSRQDLADMDFGEDVRESRSFSTDEALVDTAWLMRDEDEPIAEAALQGQLPHTNARMDAMESCVGAVESRLPAE
jgi:plasmid stabilization system protein ParE